MENNLDNQNKNGEEIVEGTAIEEIPSVVDKYMWEREISIFANHLIIKRMAIALGAPYIVIMLVVMIASKVSSSALIACGLLTLILGTLVALFLVFYRKKFEVSYIVDEEGVQEVVDAKKAKIRKSLLVIGSMLARQSGQTTLSISLATSGTKARTFIKWKSISKVSYSDKHQYIHIVSNVEHSIYMFGTADNYFNIKEFVLAHIKKDVKITETKCFLKKRST